MRLPHPIPYQGSKRNLAPLIVSYFPPGIETLYEPFAGSAAVTLYAAHHRLAKKFMLGDTLEPMVDLWRSIVEEPERTAARYQELWEGQKPGDWDYYNQIRTRYNRLRDPVGLLYLVARCVKNSVRFNSSGNFTQSVDKRRLGMRPEKMRTSILGASFLLRGRTEFRNGDWLETVAYATTKDFVYLDPPYLGTTIGRDKRYYKQMDVADLCAGLRRLIERDVPLALSYDGMTGQKEYGPPLPNDLNLTRLLLHAGRSSQATLQGKAEDTIESLYLSPGLAEPLDQVLRHRKAVQESFLF